MATASKGGDGSGCPICGKPMTRGAGGNVGGGGASGGSGGGASGGGSGGASGAAKPAADPFPFCSTRCQLVDLGRWLGDEYRIPDRETVVWPPPDDDGSSGDDR